jgi:twitching motility protein PilU
MDFNAYLSTMVEKDASDLYLSSGAPISAKINGILTRLEETPLTPEQVRGVAWSIMNEVQIAEFEQRPEMNLAISETGIGRFRVNIFRQRNSVSMVIRNIKTDIPDWSKLGLPEVLTKVILEKRGLVLFVGATGSGKSTSLASLIDYRNSNSAGHIITARSVWTPTVTRMP